MVSFKTYKLNRKDAKMFKSRNLHLGQYDVSFDLRGAPLNDISHLNERHWNVLTGMKGLNFDFFCFYKLTV